MGQAENDGDGLPAAPGLLQPEFRDRPVGKRIAGGAAALAAALGLTASAANSPSRRRIHNPRVPVLHAHSLMLLPRSSALRPKNGDYFLLRGSSDGFTYLKSTGP